MKKPLIKECPACGAELRNKNGFGQIIRNYSTDCQQTCRADGSIDSFVLSHSCNNCGCKWVHGQFETAVEPVDDDVANHDYAEILRTCDLLRAENSLFKGENLLLKLKIATINALGFWERIAFAMRGDEIGAGQ